MPTTRTRTKQQAAARPFSPHEAQAAIRAAGLAEAERVVAAREAAVASAAVNGEEQGVYAHKHSRPHHNRSAVPSHRTHVVVVVVVQARAVRAVVVCNGCAAHSRSHSCWWKERSHSHSKHHGIRRLRAGMSVRARAPYAGQAPAARSTDRGHTRLDRRTARRRRRARTGARARVRHNHKVLWARFGTP